MPEITGRCWPTDIPFTTIIDSKTGKPYVKNGFICEIKAGDFRFKDDSGESNLDPKQIKVIEFWCPRTGTYCGTISVGYPDKPNDCKNTWKWDGNYEKPTLTPSINCISGCGWHGFLTKGVFKD